MEIPDEAGTSLHIASFETLAQFALLQCTHHITGHSHLQINVPTGTDSTATEAGLNKLFTTLAPKPLPQAHRSMGPRSWHSTHANTHTREEE